MHNTAHTAAATAARKNALYQPDRECKIPPGDRLINSGTLRKLRGGITRQTLWRHIKTGAVPQPDAVICGLHYWLESRFVGESS